MRRAGRTWLAACGLAAAGATLAAAGATPGAEQAAAMRFGMSPGVIEGVSPADARAASMVWAEGISGTIGLFKTAEAIIFSSLDDAVRAVSDGRAQLAVLTSREYLDVERRIACSPAMVYEVQGEVTQEFVLVGRGRTAPRPPASASIAVYAPSREQDLPRLWADTHFQEQGDHGGLAAFAAVRPMEKRGRATTAVFFGQADYGVDVSSAYDSAVELNPQIGRDVVVLARSPRLLPGLVCIAHAMPAAERQRFVDRGTRLHEQVRYQQSMVIMRMTRLVAWQPSMLDTTRALVARHAALLRKGGDR